MSSYEASILQRRKMIQVWEQDTGTTKNLYIPGIRCDTTGLEKFQGRTRKRTPASTKSTTFVELSRTKMRPSSFISMKGYIFFATKPSTCRAMASCSCAFVTSVLPDLISPAQIFIESSDTLTSHKPRRSTCIVSRICFVTFHTKNSIPGPSSNNSTSFGDMFTIGSLSGSASFSGRDSPATEVQYRYILHRTGPYEVRFKCEWSAPIFCFDRSRRGKSCKIPEIKVLTWGETVWLC
mmetsp:Transcript_18096/g.31230  ORF Transcript_18096/g.31230 Transcript_18096/m.31230 type:complete len:237 (-) Transcript_18096:450-1160(-)